MGFAGGQNGKFFHITAPHIDRKLAPGFSPIPAPSFLDWLSNSPFVLVNSPNTIWALIALAFYFAFPYDLSPVGAAAQAPLSQAFFLERFPLWVAVTFGYTSFWHMTLYFLGWGERPFIANRVYNVDKVVHNLFWSLSGVVIWTGFENVAAFLWATGRLPYITDAQSFGSPAGIASFIAALALVPVWRDAHFYFAHRLLHFKALYTQVHSLHHRNTDIEPFSGLCMHPIEHLYYYACIAPSLVFACTPFAFLWNGMHLLLSPGASHSGYEDHFQSDAYHYIHHRQFEANYAGTGAAFLDVAFGTFVPKFVESSPDKVKAREDAKSSLRVPPTIEFLTYLTLAGGSVAAWAYAAVSVARGTLAVTPAQAAGLALLAGFGPVFVAIVMTAVKGGAGGTPTLDPKNTWGSVAQLAMGTMVCSAPVSLACYLAF